MSSEIYRNTIKFTFRAASASEILAGEEERLVKELRAEGAHQADLGLAGAHDAGAHVRHALVRTDGQRALQELVRHWLTAVQRFEMATDIDQSEVLRTVLHADMQNIRTTTEEIDAKAFDDVVDKIIGARHIYIMGLRSAAPIAQFLAYYLNFIFDNVRTVSEASGDVFEQISRINESDLLFGISFPRYSTRTLEAMSFAKARGAQVVGLTDGPMSPLCA